MTDKAHPAGLTYAPPYDSSQDLDPDKVKAVVIPRADLDKLEYFQHQARIRNNWERGLVIALVIAMLGINLWLTHRNYAALLINMNQSRLDQVTQIEALTTQIEGLNTQLNALQKQLEVPPAGPAPEIATR